MLTGSCLWLHTTTKLELRILASPNSSRVFSGGANKKKIDFHSALGELT
jgi:hypothetical protein